MKKPAFKNGVSVKAYKGDAMTLLAFSLEDNLLENFTGFSIKVSFGKQSGYYLFNKLTYKTGAVKINLNQGDDITTSEFSPIQKFNWVHVPSTQHNIGKPFYGKYTYQVTPRYIRNKELQPLDKKLTTTISIDVSPFEKGDFKLGFTRGFVASQAYVNNFGNNNKVRPNDTDLVFDLSQQSGPKPKEKNKEIKPYTFEKQFNWMGWQARMRIYEILDEVLKNKNMTLDVFAYDLDEPFICNSLIKLAKEERVRIILDNASLHTGVDKKGHPAFEDVFEDVIENDVKKAALLVRGRFSRFSHSKVFIQKLNTKPVKVLTGSTNFSTNGLYINANHVLIFNNAEVAQLYEDVFNESFGTDKMKDFRNTTIAAQSFDFTKKKELPEITIRFSPHSKTFAAEEITQIATRVKKAGSDILFAIMNDTTGSGDLLKTIRTAHERDDIFTYGIVDKSKDVTLYKPNSKKGVRVAGIAKAERLPPPFKEEEKIPGISIHHKFVVVDFKGKDPVVFCGSSNLAQIAETENGDNLIEIRDREIVTAFAIEAMRLIDHFHFRNREQKKEIHLYITEWFKNYYNPKDLRCLERELLVKEDEE
jgi:phosphatidylserine/phosphatidylglycerophosphate/cardiolipin synthase-like enzyme